MFSLFLSIDFSGEADLRQLIGNGGIAGERFVEFDAYRSGTQIANYAVYAVYLR